MSLNMLINRTTTLAQVYHFQLTMANAGTCGRGTWSHISSL